MRRDKSKKQQIVEGELSSLVVYSERTHVDYIYGILDDIEEILRKDHFDVQRLGDTIRSGQNYLDELEKLVENSILGIILLDGLRPNVLFEFGFLFGRHKPLIILQSQSAYVCIKTLYNNIRDSGLTDKQFRMLTNPCLDLQKQLSDLGGRHVLRFDHNAGKTQNSHIINVLAPELDKLRGDISKEIKKGITKGKEVSEITEKILELHSRATIYKDISDHDIAELKNIYQEIRNLP